MRTTKGFALLGTMILLSWAVVGMTNSIPEAEGLGVGDYDWRVGATGYTGKSSTSYYQPINLGMFSWLLFW